MVEWWGGEPRLRHHSTTPPRHHSPPQATRIVPSRNRRRRRRRCRCAPQRPAHPGQRPRPSAPVGRRSGRGRTCCSSGTRTRRAPRMSSRRIRSVAPRQRVRRRSRSCRRGWRSTASYESKSIGMGAECRGRRRRGGEGAGGGGGGREDRVEGRGGGWRVEGGGVEGGGWRVEGGGSRVEGRGWRVREGRGGSVALKRLARLPLPSTLPSTSILASSTGSPPRADEGHGEERDEQEPGGGEPLPRGGHRQEAVPVREQRELARPVQEVRRRRNSPATVPYAAARRGRTANSSGSGITVYCTPKPAVSTRNSTNVTAATS